MPDTIDNSEPASPCVGICRLDTADVCTGCYRSLGEIADWMNASAQSRREILARCRHRRSARESVTNER